MNDAAYLPAFAHAGTIPKEEATAFPRWQLLAMTLRGIYHRLKLQRGQSTRLDRGEWQAKCVARVGGWNSSLRASKVK